MNLKKIFLALTISSLLLPAFSQKKNTKTTSSSKTPTTTKTVEAKNAVDRLKKNPNPKKDDAVIVYNEDFEKGEELFQLNKPKEAIVYFEKALEKENVDPKVYVYLGVCYYQIENYEKSLQVCVQGMAKEGTDKKVLAYNAGNSCYALGNYMRADASYAIALSEDENYAPALLNRANAQLKLDHLEDARTNYKKYLEVESESNQKEKIEVILRLLDEEITRRANEKPELVNAEFSIENEKMELGDEAEKVTFEDFPAEKTENQKVQSEIVKADSVAPVLPKDSEAKKEDGEQVGTDKFGENKVDDTPLPKELVMADGNPPEIPEEWLTLPKKPEEIENTPVKNENQQLSKNQKQNVLGEKLGIDENLGRFEEENRLSLENARRLEEERKAKEAEEARKKAEQERIEEENKRRAEEEARLQAETKRRAAEAELTRIEEETRRAKEEARLAEENRRKAEEEARRIQEEERQRQAEERIRRLEEEARQKEEAALKAQKEAEERIRKLEEEAKKAEENARIAEQNRKIEEELARIEEEKRREEARKAEEKRIQQEKAEAERKAIEAELSRIEEEKAKKEAEEKAAREAEEKKKAEEDAKKAAEEAIKKAREEAYQAEIKKWPAPKASLYIKGGERFTPDGDGRNDTVTFYPGSQYLEEEPENWVISITDPKGNPFKVIEGNGKLPETIEWDGKSDDGEVVVSRNTYNAKFSILPSQKDRARTGKSKIETSEKIQTGLLLEVIVPGHEWKIVVQSIAFDPNGEGFGKVTNEQKKSNSQTLDEVADEIRALAGTDFDVNIIIEGYANNISGTEKEQVEELLPLSQKRAETIVDELVKRGIDRKLLTPKGLGGANPIASQDDHDNWWKNRRVEFRIKQ